MALKKELGLRERRKIYEDAINVVAQTKKMVDDKSQPSRAMKNLVDKQFDRCSSILATVLGCHERTIVNPDETRNIMLMPEDDDNLYSIEKSKFDEIVQQLPDNKDLRESLWKTFVKRDQKAKAKLDAMIA